MGLTVAPPTFYSSANLFSSHFFSKAPQHAEVTWRALATARQFTSTRHLITRHADLPRSAHWPLDQCEIQPGRRANRRSELHHTTGRLRLQTK